MLTATAFQSTGRRRPWRQIFPTTAAFKFGTVYDGKLALEQGGYMDVVVKVSVAARGQSSPAVLGDTLRLVWFRFERRVTVT